MDDWEPGRLLNIDRNQEAVSYETAIPRFCLQPYPLVSFFVPLSTRIEVVGRRPLRSRVPHWRDVCAT